MMLAFVDLVWTGKEGLLYKSMTQLMKPLSRTRHSFSLV
jgi:hypothetical protein